MGILDDLLGRTAADAAKRAAADTYAKQTEAVNSQIGAADTFAKKFQPWENTGLSANDAVLRLLSDPSSVRSLPAYQFMLGEGTKAIDRSAAANGSLFSGRTGKALESYGQNLADKSYGDQLARLLGISQQGLGATGVGEGGALNARNSAYGNLFGSAGTIGQGDVAAANARAKGTQNLFNLGGSLLGTALSGGTGGFSNLFSGAGNAIGGLLAPKGGYTGWTG